MFKPDATLPPLSKMLAEGARLRAQIRSRRGPSFYAQFDRGDGTMDFDAMEEAGVDIS